MTRNVLRGAAMLAIFAPASLAAQWRAEASVAAGRARVSDPLAQVAAPATGTVAGVLAWEFMTHGAWRMELVGAAGHESLAGRSGGDARTVARLAWSRESRAGLTLEGGATTAWRSWLAEEAPSSAPDDTTLMEHAPTTQRSTYARRVPGATGGAGAWARARGVLLSANVRTTTLGSVTESWQETRFRMVDSVDVRARWDSLNGLWHLDTLGTRQIRTPYLATGERLRRLLQTDVSLGASSNHGALGLAFVGGVRRATLGDGGDGWGTMRATWALRGDVALSAQASRLARDAQRQLPARRELQLGVVLRPWGGSTVPVALPVAAATRARTFAARRLDGDRVTIVLDAPGARTIELMGDFTSWRIVSLEHGRGSTWELTVAIPRGVHQLNVRVDGGVWMPPPGLGVGDDGFGGTFGLLVL